MLPIEKKFVKYNYTSAPGRKIEYVCIHDTGNPGHGANANAHFNYFNGGNRNASADFFVDDSRIVQIVDYVNNYSWAVGDGGGRYGITNGNSVSIELCINSDGNFEKTFVHGAELAAHMLKTLGLPISRLKRHYDASRKNCPNVMSANGWAKWNQFVSKVESIMNGGSSSSGSGSTTTPSPTTEFKVGTYQRDVVITTDVLNVRNARGTQGDIIGKFTRGQVVNVWYIDKANDGSLWGSCGCNGKTGYIHLGYAKPVGESSSKPSQPKPPTTPASIGVGSKVKITGTHYATGEAIPSSVKSGTYTVQQMGSGKALLKEIVSWVKTTDLVLAGSSSGSSSSNGEYTEKEYAENATAKVVCDALNVRSVPRASGNTPVAKYSKGETFRYDRVVLTNKYVYCSYIARSGNRRYVAVKNRATGERFANCY